MSKRSDIIDGAEAANVPFGLVYTEVLGWIDLGHAQGNDIRALLRSINNGELSGNEYYDVTYSQSMTDPTRTLKMGKFITWRIKHGRPYFERKRIALAMMMSLASKFETLQATFPLSLTTDSGFSGEDLVSDLLGFYRVISIQNPFVLLRPVNKTEALKRWDYYGGIGNWKNYSFRPLLFPDPERFPNAIPHKADLPNFMRKIIPWRDFRSDIVRIAKVDGLFIDSGSNGVLPYA